MNIRFLITAAIAAISISVYAQKPPAGVAHPGGPGQGQRGPGGMRRGGMMVNPELQKELGLTATQKAKMKAISDKYQPKMRAAMGGIKFTPGQRPDPKQMEAMRAKMKPIRDAEQKEIDAVMTAKQRATLAKWRAAHPRPSGPGGMRAPGGTRGGAATGGGKGHGG